MALLTRYNVLSIWKLIPKRDVGGILLNQESLLSISSNALFIAFILLLIAIVPLGLAVKSKRKIFGKLGLLFTYIAFALQLVYFVVRWVAVDHAPVSNMYEFMTFFGIMLTGSYLIIHFLYKQIVVGLFTIPVSLIILGYGSVFAKEVSPLVPSLQSHWLTIHVMTVAFSSAILSVSFATGLIYLLRTLDVSKNLSVHTGLSLCCIVWWLSLALLAYRLFQPCHRRGAGTIR